MVGCAVIDTNVFVVCDNGNTQVSDACATACVAMLEHVVAGLQLTVDSAGEIFAEYLGAVQRSDRNALAAKTVVRLYRTYRSACRVVDITPSTTNTGSYDEVPELLRDFDADDQKFIAVALADVAKPQIFTALDGEWLDRRCDFATAGIDVQFLCLADLIARASA